MNLISANSELRNERLTKKLIRGFAWNAKLPAPFGQQGVYCFRLRHPGVFDPVDRELSRETLELILRFASTFCVLAIGTDITPYTNTLTELMRADGVEEADYFPRLALPLIVTGLSNYATVLGCFLNIVEGDPIKTPISMMHIWALGEAARIQASCICAGGNWPDVFPDAENVMALTQAENYTIHESEEPYKNIFLEGFDAA